MMNTYVCTLLEDDTKTGKSKNIFYVICEVCVNDRAHLVLGRGKKTNTIQDVEKKMKGAEGKRSDTGPALTNKGTFSATTSIQKPGIVPKS